MNNYIVVDDINYQRSVGDATIFPKTTFLAKRIEKMKEIDKEIAKAKSIVAMLKAKKAMKQDYTLDDAVKYLKRLLKDSNAK